eukprot:FR735966.1.p3 GENE.FR735966.1~~FR735966.1.p3  ORF type:complete len:111 (+),score=60.21 FR735966.1:896-1228(+)
MFWRDRKKKKKKKKKKRPAGIDRQGSKPRGTPLFLKTAPPPGGNLPLFVSPYREGYNVPLGANTWAITLFLWGKIFLSPSPNFPPTIYQIPEKTKKRGKKLVWVASIMWS